MHVLLWTAIGLLVTQVNPWWLRGAQAQRGEVHVVCWGQDENSCKRRPYTYFAPCGFLGHAGANPVAITRYLCGTGPDGTLKGTYANIDVGNPGGQCGYSWFEV